MKGGSFVSPGDTDLSDRQILEADRIESHRKIQASRQVSSLCGRCTHVQIIRQRRHNDAEVWCHMFEPAKLIGSDVVDCSRFKAEGSLDIWALAQLAKVIELDKNQIVGFNTKTTP